MAVERVERRLRQVTAAFDGAGIPYAVIGGNAVAAWIARVDPSATRATKNVDLLVERGDLDRITKVMTLLGFVREDLRALVLFNDSEEPSRRAGVHLVWAGQRVRPSYSSPAPSVSESTTDPQGFAVVNLSALVGMKLTSFRRIDQVHIEDLIRVGLVDDEIESSLSRDLRARLDEVRRTMDQE